MKKILILFMSIIFIGAMASSARAATIDLYDYVYNIDGDLAAPIFGDPVPDEANESSFNRNTGLGTIDITVFGAGSHFVGLYVDHEIDEVVNTFHNEYGDTNGSAALGQSWEIDEPLTGNILYNFDDSGYLDPFTSFLDNTIGLTVAEDVSMALGWDFTLVPGYFATITFNLTTDIEDVLGSFYLIHTDPDSSSPANIYFASTLSIEPVPEPTTIALLGIGLAGLAGGAVRRKWKKQAVDKS